MSKKIDLSPYHDIIKENYCYNNKTDEEICELLPIECSTSLMSIYRRKNDIKRLYTDSKWLIEMHEKGYSSVKASSFINCSPSTVSRAWIKLGIIESKKKETLTANNDFFSDYNELSSYWAGFINADAHIEAYDMYGRSTPNYKLKFVLSEKDSSHLQNFIEDIGCNGNTKEREVFLKATNKTYKQVEFKIGRKKICTDLINNFSIIHTNKSMNEDPPLHLPKEFKRHYIRGYFDGDGSIGYYGSKKVITIVGSKKICDFIVSSICEEYNLTSFGKVSKDAKGSDLYYLYVYKTDAILMFNDYIYRDATRFLKRKKDIFDKINLRYSLASCESMRVEQK